MGKSQAKVELGQQKSSCQFMSCEEVLLLDSWICLFPTTENYSEEALQSVLLLFEEQGALNRSVSPGGPRSWGT